MIFGDYAGDQVLASALGLPRPGIGEFVSARLVRCREDGRIRDYAGRTRIPDSRTEVSARSLSLPSR